MHTKGSLSLNVNTVITEVGYKGQDLRQLLLEAISQAQRGVDQTVLTALADATFDTVRSLDQQDAKKELSIHLTNFFFESFTILWTEALDKGAHSAAASLWILACGVAWGWESKNQPYELHKGTPYFFLGKTLALSGNYDLAFLMIHNALEEDKRTYPLIGKNYQQDAPAYLFASLIDNPASAMYDYVDLMRKYLRKAGSAHNSATGAGFSERDFDRKFLQNTDLEAEKFFFVYNLMLIINMNTLRYPRLLSNAFTELRSMNLLFNLSLIVDKVLHLKYGTALMGDGVTSVLRHLENIPEKDPPSLLKALSYANGSPFAIRDDPGKVVPALLAGDVKYKGGGLNPPMRAFLCAWNLRNHGAHNVGGGLAASTSNFAQTLDFLFSALFFSVAQLS